MKIAHKFVHKAKLATFKIITHTPFKPENDFDYNNVRARANNCLSTI